MEKSLITRHTWAANVKGHQEADVSVPDCACPLLNEDVSVPDCVCPLQIYYVVQVPCTEPRIRNSRLFLIEFENITYRFYFYPQLLLITLSTSFLPPAPHYYLQPILITYPHLITSNCNTSKITSLCFLLSQDI